LIGFSVVWNGWNLYRGQPSIFFYYFIVILVLPLLFFHYKTFFKKLLYAHFVIITIGVTQIALGNNTAFLFIKVYAGLLIVSTFSFYAIKLFKYDAVQLFRYSLFWTYIMAAIGVIQFFSYLIEFEPGYDLNWFSHNSITASSSLIRITSIMGEPSVIAQVFAPAFFLAFCRILELRPFIIKSRLAALLIIFVYIFSQSSTAFIGIFATLLILIINFTKPKNLLISGAVGFLMFNMMYTSSDGFRQRVNSALMVYDSYDLNVSLDNSSGLKRNHSIDGSTFVLFNNLFVAFRNVTSSPINAFMGSGIGSHQKAYDKYSLTRNFEEFFNISDLNYADANSLGIRLLSEFGFIGMLFSGFLLFGCFVRRTELNLAEPYWVVSGAILTFLIVTYIRKGHYFHYGLTMYMMLYYFNWKNNKDFLKRVSEKGEESVII